MAIKTFYGMVDHNLFSKPLILVHLGCFQLFDVINNAAKKNTPKPTFLIVSVYFFRRDF